MASVEGLNKLTATLRDRVKQVKEDGAASVVVGYSAPGAVMVHEDLEALHGSLFNEVHADEISRGVIVARRPQEQAKYLEQPGRDSSIQEQIRQATRKVLEAGGSLEDGLMAGGEVLLAASQELVPGSVEGELGASGFVKIED